jgi:hypothetical protein
MEDPARLGVMPSTTRLTTRRVTPLRSRLAPSLLALPALLALACGAPPEPRGRYTLVSVDGQPVPIGASFYTPAVGFTSDLVGGDLLVCSPSLVVRTDRVREQDNTVPADDSRAHPHESWMTEAMAVRRDGRRLYLVHAAAAAARPDPIDTGAVLGEVGDTIAIDQHSEQTGAASTRRYLFARAAADTASPGHAGTLCGSYMHDRSSAAADRTP